MSDVILIWSGGVDWMDLWMHLVIARAREANAGESLFVCKIFAF